MMAVNNAMALKDFFIIDIVVDENVFFVYNVKLLLPARAGSGFSTSCGLYSMKFLSKKNGILSKNAIRRVYRLCNRKLAATKKAISPDREDCFCAILWNKLSFLVPVKLHFRYGAYVGTYPPGALFLLHKQHPVIAGPGLV